MTQAAPQRYLKARHGEATETLSASFSPLLARLYAARGVNSPAEVDFDLARLHPPQLLYGMSEATARVVKALQNQERILVVGDFDADGATSTALAVDALRAFGAEHVDYLVPNRFEYGYGLTPEIVALACQRSPQLIITVDNGISSLEGVAAANQAGVEVLITDHHLAGERLPDASVILNPNQPACTFPSKALAGVGVMFYLLMALRTKLRDMGWFAKRAIEEPRLGDYLDLVALGTVADVVPLDRNNRLLVEGGLRRIRAGRARPGIAALLSVAGKNPSDVAASDLGFAAGPRLNAAGRLDDMSLGIEALLAPELEGARAIALQLDSMNRERQRIERGMQADALALLARLDVSQSSCPPALVLYEPSWHQGVVGILASRLKDQFHRPAIAFADTGSGMLKGSGRGIAGLHLRDLLDAVATQNPGLISHFGGHAMAAGLSLPQGNFEAFREAMCAAVTKTNNALLEPAIDTDGELASEEMTLAVAETLRRAGPWGQQFPEPLFDGDFILLSQRIVGERHLKMTVAKEEDGPVFDAIAFSVDADQWPADAVQRVRIAYRLDVNEFRGERRVQLLVTYLEAA